MIVLIQIEGCDDTTPIFMNDITPVQFEFLRLLERKCKESSYYECMPLFKVYYQRLPGNPQAECSKCYKEIGERGVSFGNEDFCKSCFAEWYK